MYIPARCTGVQGHNHCLLPRDSLGGCTVVGDLRWTGSYGMQADIVARTHCSVELIKIEDIHVGSPCQQFYVLLFVLQRNSDHLSGSTYLCSFLLMNILRIY